MTRVGLMGAALCLAATTGTLAASAPSAPRPAGYLLVHQNVSSYSVWRRAYDADAANRQASGLSSCSVFQNTGDPNDVMFLCSYTDPKKATTFSASPFLKTAIQAPSRTYFIRASSDTPAAPKPAAKSTKKKK